MASVVTACLLVLTLVWVLCDVQAGDQYPIAQRDMAEVLVAIGHLQHKVQLQEKEVATIAAMGKVKAVTALEKTVKAHETKITTLENENQAQETKITAHETKIATQETKITAQETKIATQETKITAQETKITALEKALAKTNEAVGFTVSYTKDVSSSGVMTFHYVETNTGNDYNITTGVFTCKTPGYYLFFASLQKSYDYDGSAYCWISKNGNYIVQAYTQPGQSPGTGATAAVNGAYLHLNKGDTVKLRDCTETASWSTGSYSSSFSGILVRADAA